MTIPTAIAFLPGTSGRGDFWAPVAERFPEFRSVFFDWPGFGGIESDPSVSSFNDLASLVIEQLDGPTVVVGQSMGGVVAALVAARRPDLVSHLVLAVTSGGVDMGAFGAADWRPASRATHPDSPAWTWEDRPDTTDVLASLPMKTLLIWATDDQISPLTVGAYLDGLIPRSRLVVFESDDHWVARENEALVADEIRALIMPTVGLIHTAEVHVATFDQLIDAAAPSNVRVEHVVDAELLARARTFGVDDPGVCAGTRAALERLSSAGADIIVCTCSTIGGLAEVLPSPVRVLRVDRPMAAEALVSAETIAVVVALESTLEPTLGLLFEEAKRAHRSPRVVSATCLEAWALFESGDSAGYANAIADYVNALPADIDTVVLAQASMLSALTLIDQTSRRVFASPPSAVKAALAALIP